MYGALGLAILSAVLGFSSGGAFGFIGGITAVALAAVGIALLNFGYILMPVVTKFARITLVSKSGEYEVPPSEEVLVKKAGNVYYASVFLGLKMYESPTDRLEEEKISYSEFFERAISSFRYVTKVGYLLYVEEIAKKRQDIEEKRAELQLRIKRERERGDPDPLRLDRLQRELEIEDVKLTRLIRGIKPMGLVGFAMTTAAGVSRDSAIASARAQAEQVRTSIANSLNVDVRWLSGEQMLRCFEWEAFLPASVQELEESLE